MLKLVESGIVLELAFEQKLNRMLMLAALMTMIMELVIAVMMKRVAMMLVFADRGLELVALLLMVMLMLMLKLLGLMLMLELCSLGSEYRASFRGDPQPLPSMKRLTVNPHRCCSLLTLQMKSKQCHHHKWTGQDTPRRFGVECCSGLKLEFNKKINN